MKPEDIITDEEIERVHANANFGGQSKRDVVAYALLQTACGYSTGHTARMILQEHGLIGTTRSRRGVGRLRKKGREYLWATFGSQSY